jgi:hypothetical protein
MITSGFVNEAPDAAWAEVLAQVGPIFAMRPSVRSDDPKDTVEEEAPAPVAHSAPSSMSGGSRPIGGPVSYDLSAAIEPTVSAEPELLAWLLRETRVLQPVPFLDGIFRPPRC